MPAGQPIPDADRALADELWRASDNMRTVLLSGLEDLGDLVACASFADGGNELDTDSVGKVGWLVAEIARLIEGALMVEDCAGALRTPDNPEPPSPPAAG